MPESDLNPGQGPRIPDKLYFRIGEVSRIVGVQPYVLRYWETEFPALSPKKSGSGQRLYKRKEVELLLEIKDLLYVKRFTIEGARRRLETGHAAPREPQPASKPQPKDPQGDLFAPAEFSVDDLRRELAEILQLLR